MITQKFVTLIEKVYEAIEFRHVNDAFDCIIEEANANFEREEGLLQDFWNLTWFSSIYNTYISIQLYKN